MMLGISFASYSQQLITISGVVVDEETMAPVPFHPVYVTASDSLFLQVYFTDESGFFRDSVLQGGMIIDSLNFLTFDCRELPHDTTVGNLNQLVFVEFLICTDSIPAECQSEFTYLLDSMNTQPRTYQFFDLSSGNIDSWYWDFGDGNISFDQHPAHQYAGGGQYSVCLTVSSTINPNICFDTHCLDVTTPGYYNFGGLVWAGEYPLNNPVFSNDTGMVSLYRAYQEQVVFVESKLFSENGYYWFTDMIEGKYLLKVGLTQGSPSYSDYLPTYFGDQVVWDAAQWVHLDSDQFELNIHLHETAGIPAGNGEIYGNVMYSGNEPIGYGQIISVILADSSHQPLRSTLPSPSGGFSFTGLPFGTYFVRADMAGRYSEPVMVTLTSNVPVSGLLELIVNEATYLYVPEDQSISLLAGHVYPNPAGDWLNIDIEFNAAASIELLVTDMMGRKVLKERRCMDKDRKTLQMHVSSLPSGIYFLRILSNDGKAPVTRKFIR